MARSGPISHGSNVDAHLRPMPYGADKSLPFPEEELTCVFVQLPFPARLGFCEAQALPGVRLVPRDRLGFDLASFDALDKGWPPVFDASHAILVDHNQYVAGLVERVRAEGGDPRHLTVGDDEWSGVPVGGAPIAMNVMLALFLLGRTPFLLGARCQLIRRRVGRGTRIEIRGGSHSEPVGTIPMRNYVWPLAEAQLVLPPAMRRMASAIEPYFRTNLATHDRLGHSLGYFWDSITSPSQVLGYLGLMSTLESLVGKERGELTHRVAERVAVLLGTDFDTRKKIYGEVKVLYETRSALVHGDIMLKKGKINGHTTAVTASLNIVDVRAHTKMLEIVTDTLKKLIRNDKFRALLKSPENGEPKMRDFFLERVLGPSRPMRGSALARARKR